MSNSEAFNRALGLALKSLAGSEKFSGEISRILDAKDVDGGTSEEVLAHLKGKNLLNDRRCAELAVTRMSAKFAGREKIRQKLLSRGCPEELLAELLPEEDDLDLALAAVRKKFPNGAPSAKIARFLYSRGFGERSVENIIGLNLT